MAEGGKRSQTLFADISFVMIPEPCWEEGYDQTMIDALTSRGAKHITANPSSSGLPLDELTHIISNTSDFPGFDEADDAFISIVQVRWIAQCVTKNKVVPVRAYTPDPRLFFSGITVACGDLPEGDKDAIIGGVMAMGGQHSSGVSGLVTHVVALSDDDEKLLQVKEKKLSRIQVVLPHWFDDCLKLGKRIDEGPYRLPNPELTRAKPSDPVPPVKSKDVMGASSPQPDPIAQLRQPIKVSRKELMVFRGKKVMLSDDLGLSSHLRETAESLVKAGGGSIAKSASKTSMLICRYRSGQEYVAASQAGRDVGNLAWFYFMITHNKWTAPTRRLLHYPIARDGIPGFKDYVISVSNYGGEARLYLENLIVAAGGRFTKTLRPENTHLVTARDFGDKSNAAREWSVNIVNHLWLEESYSKWKVQSLTNTRYTHFPPRTNLSEIVGRTQIERDAIETFIYPKSDEESSEDELSHQREEEPLPSQADIEHPKSDPTTIADVKQLEITSKSKTAKNGIKKDGSLKTPAKLTPSKPKPSAATPLKTNGADQAVDTPGTGGSRGAKDRAVAKLHDLTEDMARFQKEMKRVGGVLKGGPKVMEDMIDPNRKRSIGDAGDAASTSDNSDGERANKKPKKALPPVRIRLLVTSYNPWIGSAVREAEDKRTLRDLGVLVVSTPSTCTHLAAPRLVRTPKFVTAIAKAPVILSLGFIDFCLEHKKLPDESAYILRDPETEKRMGISLKDALKRASKNNGKLLSSYTIYCTQIIQAGFENYKAICDVNGAKCLSFRSPSRPGSTVNARTISDGGNNDEDEDEEEIVYLLSGTKPQEKSLWPLFRQTMKAEGRTARIVSTDWLVDAAMSQQVKWSDEYILFPRNPKFGHSHDEQVVG